MNTSYEKNKSLKDIETKFKKYPRTNKNRFIIHIIDLFHKLVIRIDPHPPPNKIGTNVSGWHFLLTWRQIWPPMVIFSPYCLIYSSSS